MDKAFAIAAGLVVVAGSTASAQVTGVIYEIQATNTNGTGMWRVFTTTGQPTGADPTATVDNGDGSYDYDLFLDNRNGSGGALDLADTGGSGNIVATLDAFTAGAQIWNMNFDPQITLNFAVSSELETTFIISSTVVMFSTIDPAFGRASAGVTLTDNGTAIGSSATATGLFGGDFYRAEVNGSAIDNLDGGTTFAELVPGPLTTFGTTVAAEDIPPNSPFFVPIGEPVSSISAAFNFTLSAEASASGTSEFQISTVIPTPGAFGVLGLAGLVAARRRR